MVNYMYLFSESRCPWFLSIEGLSGLRGDLEHHGRRSFETRAYSLRCADLIVWEKKKRNSECEGDLGRNLMVVFCSERSRKLLGKGYRICEFLPRGLRLTILVRAGQPASQIILTGYCVPERGSDPVIWRSFVYLRLLRAEMVQALFWVSKLHSRVNQGSAVPTDLALILLIDKTMKSKDCAFFNLIIEKFWVGGIGNYVYIVICHVSKSWSSIIYVHKHHNLNVVIFKSLFLF